MNNKEKLSLQIAKEKDYLKKQIKLLETWKGIDALYVSVLEYQTLRLKNLNDIDAEHILGAETFDKIYLKLYIYANLPNSKYKIVSIWLLRVMAEIEKGIR